MSNGATMQICEFRRIGHPGSERVSGLYGTEGSYEQSLAGKAAEGAFGEFVHCRADNDMEHYTMCLKTDGVNSGDGIKQVLSLYYPHTQHVSQFL